MDSGLFSLTEFLFAYVGLLVILYSEVPYAYMVSWVDNIVNLLFNHLHVGHWSNSSFARDFKRDLLDCLLHQEVDLANQKLAFFVKYDCPRLLNTV